MSNLLTGIRKAVRHIATGTTATTAADAGGAGTRFAAKLGVR
jgi:hypothetical protein